MKFVVAQVKHETHSFVPDTTALDQFNAAGALPLSGEEAADAYRHRNCAVSAFIRIIEEQGYDCTVAVAGEAMPSGPVEDEAFEWMCGKILDEVRSGCDGVLLDLHGSMVTQSLDDGEGELLARIRKIRPDLPVGAALDFHATLTDRMLDNCDVITLYRTLPHVDMYDTGARAARMLMDMILGNTRPAMQAIRIPLMAGLEKMDPEDPPLKSVWEKIHELEGREGILNADLSCGHPFTDVYPGGMAAVVVADGSAPLARDTAEAIMTAVWEKKASLVVAPEPYKTTLEKAQAFTRGPVIMADSGDIPASGGFAADMTVLKTAMDMGFEDMVAGPFHDPEAVQKMIRAGVGAELTLDIGGRTSAPLLNYSAAPLSVTGRVRAVVDGRFTATGPMLKGLSVSIGLMAVLSAGSLDILVTEQRIEALDVAVFTHVGIDPERKKYTLLKSRQHFRAAFEPIARHVVRIAGPGVTNPDFSNFPFRNIQRPVFPLDKDADLQLIPLGNE